MDTHPSSIPAARTAVRTLVCQLLCGTLLLGSASGCATYSAFFPGSTRTDDAGSTAATSATVVISDESRSDQVARVRANAGSDVVPVDAPRFSESPGDSQATPIAADVPSEDVPRRSEPLGQVFRRLEAALDGSDPGATPPPPPRTRALNISDRADAVSPEPAPVHVDRVVSPGTPERVLPQPVDSGDMLTGPSVAGAAATELVPGDTPSSAVPSPLSSPAVPRQLAASSTLTAVEVTLPDVADWSDESRALVASTAVTGIGVNRPRRPAPWWLTIVGLVVLGGLIGLRRRFGRQRGSEPA